MKYRALSDFDLKGKTVLVRVDLNVPVDRNTGHVSDTTRIDRFLPTIKFLKDAGAKIVLLSHFGRPEGQRNEAYSFHFLPKTLQKLWSCPVGFVPDCIGPAALDSIAHLKNGEVILLENLRFHEGEEANDPHFAKALAQLGEVYINDAFSAAHRAHASTAGITRYLPSAAGLLLQAELNALSSVLEHPQKPMAAVVGGSKISTKLDILNNLVTKFDFLILGGAMANTFLFAQDMDMGRSMLEKDMKDQALKIMAAAARSSCRIILPRDFVCVDKLEKNAPFRIENIESLSPGSHAVDTGPESLRAIIDVIKKCRTVLWNGPLGVFEIKPFDHGTNVVAQAVAEQTQHGKLISVAGGGDTAAALENASVTDRFSYISTAGGAFLEWLEGKTLPGIAALENASG